MLAAFALIAAMSHPSLGSMLDDDTRQALPGGLLARLDQTPKKPDDAAAKLQRDIDNDIKLGQEYEKQVDKDLKPSDDKEGLARIQRIGAEMADIANHTEVEVSWGDKRHSQFPYKFKLVKGKDVNAFSLPGGIIYVYDGLLSFVESDDELAAVLGHEVSHAAFRHLAILRKEQSKFDWIQIPLLIAVALSRGPDAMNVLAASQYTMQGLASGWSVSAEEAADFGGFQFEIHSHYNPVGALTFMERLAHQDQLGENRDWGIFQTHPPTKERFEFMKHQLMDHSIPIKRSEVCHSLAVNIKTDPKQGSEIWFAKNLIATLRGPGSEDRADAAQKRLNEFFDQVPEVFEATAEGAKVMGGNRELFEITDADTVGSGKPADQVAEDASAQLKRSILSLSMQVYKD